MAPTVLVNQWGIVLHAGNILPHFPLCLTEGTRVISLGVLLNMTLKQNIMGMQIFINFCK